MDEKQVQAMFNILQEQRNVAQNQVVQLVGQLALLEDKLKTLETPATSVE